MVKPASGQWPSNMKMFISLLGKWRIHMKILTRGSSNGGCSSKQLQTCIDHVNSYDLLESRMLTIWRFSTKGWHWILSCFVLSSKRGRIVELAPRSSEFVIKVSVHTWLSTGVQKLLTRPDIHGYLRGPDFWNIFSGIFLESVCGIL